MQKTNHGLVIIGLALGMLTMVVSGGTSAGAADKAPAGQAAVEKGPKAIIKTKFGEIEIKFFPDRAPKHVENFIKLGEEGRLQRNDFSSHHSGLYDSRRRSQHERSEQKRIVRHGRPRL